MAILNFGSLNIDCVCAVEHIVQPGQTIDSTSFTRFPGGKGMNQSLALARAGGTVYHAGMIGSDGEFLRALLLESGADCTWLKTVPGSSGTAFIQVDQKGQNSIVLVGGANRANTPEYCDQVLSGFGDQDMLLLQNEINQLPYLVDRAYEKSIPIALNPAPMNEAVLACDLSKIFLFIMNEDEGCRITGETQPERILERMHTLYPQAPVVLTLGSQGSVYSGNGQRIHQKAYPVTAVDTTGAGDTFTGYLLAGMARGDSMEQCMKEAAMASAIAVTRQGAASSIPTRAEVLAALQEA